jgi:hypothetical protein
MATLFEISERYQNILEIAEMLDEEQLNEALAELDDEIESKADGYARIIAELENKVEGFERFEKEFKEKKEKTKKNIDRMKQTLQEEMERIGKTKFETEAFSFSIRKYKGSVVIKDESKIPEDCWTEAKIIEAKPDKNKLYKILKRYEDEGEKVEWAELTENKGLSIK